MQGTNRTHHIGSVIEPHMSYTRENLAVLTFTLGIREEAEGRAKTAYLPVKLFGTYAEALEPLLTSNSVVELFGKLDQSSYEDESGKPRTSNTLIPEQLLVLKGDFTFFTDKKGQKLLENGLNEITLSGNATKDADLRITSGGTKVTNLRLAVNERQGEREHVLYLNVTGWNAQAEQLETLQRGDGMSVTGRLLNDSYKRDGDIIYILVLEATRAYPLKAKKRTPVADV